MKREEEFIWNEHHEKTKKRGKNDTSNIFHFILKRENK